MIGERVVMIKEFIGDEGELLQIDHDYGLYKLLLDGETIPLWFDREEFEVIDNEA